jgi:probable biosynthetic protein (TIGR04098 family)
LVVAEVVLSVGMLREIIREEIPGPQDFSAPILDLPIDSFGMVVLRGRIEAALGRPVSDDVWGKIETLNDVLALSSEENISPSGGAQSQVRRSYSVNMPQMAMGGLSESWLLKELGDLHWSMIASGLGSQSSSITDGGGNRLYATFTRIRYSLQEPLGAISENSALDLNGSISRFGAGTFISDIELGHDLAPGVARLMSNFSRRGEANNTSLLKGQPTIPENCQIPEVTLPAFMLEYRDRRSANPDAALFNSEYEIVPFHDINGVGLLYFAAYPIISDICSLRYLAGFSAMSTVSRDVYYFANTDTQDSLIFRIHRWELSGSALNTETSLSRKSDGALMAYLVTRKSNG